MRRLLPFFLLLLFLLPSPALAEGENLRSTVPWTT